VLDLRLGDVVRLRKQHPCGGFEWEISRLGADIAINCLECGRRVLLSRRELEKRTRSVVSSGGGPLPDSAVRETSRHC
jgi:hypothetical protein